jgi:TonB family protein
MTSIAANYRSFRLPWTPSEAEERLFRRIVGATIGLFIAFGIVIPLLPQPPVTQPLAPEASQRIVEFILTQPKPPPVEAPKPIEVPQAQAKVVTPVPVARVVPKPDPRKKAAESGLLALADELADLRDMDVDRDVKDTPLNAGVGDKTRVDRNILTASVGTNSGGIPVSRASSGFGGGSTGLAGHATAKVASSADAAPAGDVQRSGKSSKASRTREEVELVFDRNKSAIYALYARALRDNPALQGKVVLEMTIAPSGEVTECRVVSSDLGDADLERKLVARVKMFRFEARDVAPMTTTKPIEFFPA